MRFPTMWYVRPAKSQISLRIRTVYAQADQRLHQSLEYSVNVKLLSEYHLEFLSLKWGCLDSPDSTHFKMPHCWKSHVVAQLCLKFYTKTKDDISIF